VIALLAALAITAAPADADLAKMLEAKDQALLDAIAPGDRRAWDAALAPSAVYVDENGTIMDRTAYLKALDPLPAGSSGHITITDYRLTRSGDVASVIHTDDEREDYHGQHLRAGYVMTETWQAAADGWKLLMVHAYVVNHDPPAITAPPSTLDAYVGRYRASPDLVYVIQRDGDGLKGGRAGGGVKPLKLEAPDVLFAPGAPRNRKIMQREAGGRIVGFLDRREGLDVVWTRLP